MALAHSVSREFTPAKPVFLQRLADTVALWSRRNKLRAELAQLSPRDIRGLGLSQGEINFEVSKPFWRA
jgi:uncharacterized protein YjiS (DUF1127 family)